MARPTGRRVRAEHEAAVALRQAAPTAAAAQLRHDLADGLGRHGA
jgi:hypothetical protein